MIGQFTIMLITFNPMPADVVASLHRSIPVHHQAYPSKLHPLVQLDKQLRKQGEEA
jgi:hypothetical protein